MTGMRSLMVAVIAMTVLAGCNAHRIRFDYQTMRGQVIELYEEQILDNLVRAHFFEVPLHLRYTSFTGEALTDLKLTQQFSDDDNDNLLSEMGSAIVELDQNKWLFSGVAQVNNKLVVAAVPEERASVYSEYRDFASDPSKFRCSATCPAEVFKVREVKRPEGKVYCYVLDQQGFFDLVLATSFSPPAHTREETVKGTLPCRNPGLGTPESKHPLCSGKVTTK